MKLCRVSFLILFVLPITGFTADPNGNYAIWGAGNKSCHSYAIARKSDDFSTYKHYIMGFLTAYNVFTPNTYRLSGNMNLNEILVWFDDYCELKAVHAFELALDDFIIEHYDRRMKSSSSGIGR